RCFTSLCVFSCPAPVPTALYSLSLHDALPIYDVLSHRFLGALDRWCDLMRHVKGISKGILPLAGGRDPYSVTPFIRCRINHGVRSEEHTSELQSRFDLVCRLLLEKKKQTNRNQ